MILRYSLIHIAVVIGVYAIYMLGGAAQQGLSFMAGGMLSVLNLVAIIFVIQSIFEKKSIALVSLVIVIKYTALLAILYVLYKNGWEFNLSFIAGLSVMLITVGVIMFEQLRKKEK